LESEDGATHKELRLKFDMLMKTLPDAYTLTDITNDRVKACIQHAIDTNEPIDAHTLAILTLEIFTQYLFGEHVLAKRQQLATLEAASWEWRKEISMRGKADRRLKAEAVRVVVEELLPLNPTLYDVFGEKWKEPEYFSLLMQPFIISPAINTGDIMCAMKLDSTLTTPDQCLRAMHPFPIFERFVTKDIVFNNQVVVPANTQCIMFTSDFKGSSYQWPVFGAGLRSCAGMHLATPFLRSLFTHFTLMEARLFQPQIGHRYSGRHLDGMSASWSDSVSETLYFSASLLKLLVPSALAPTR
jgi:hypothetical protein